MLFKIASTLALALAGQASPLLSSASALATRQPNGPAPNGTYPNPEPCYGDCRSFNDNTIIRRSSDQMLFRFAVYHGNIYTFTATDWLNQTGWTMLKGVFLPNGPVNPIGNSNDSTWSPDVHFIDGTYYMFYTDWHTSSGQPGDHARGTISYATSPNLEIDSWTDHGPVGIPAEPGVYSRIGPNLLLPSMHLVFGSDGVGMYGVHLTKTGQDIGVVPNKTPQELVHDERVPGLAPGVKDTLSEGAFQFNYGGYIYLFFSRGHCCGTHSPKKPYQLAYRIEVCRATHTTGPYVNDKGESCLTSRGTLFMESHDYVFGPGSVGVHIDPQIGIYIHYQYQNLDLKHGTSLKDFQLGWNYLAFVDGWPVPSTTKFPPS